MLLQLASHHEKGPPLASRWSWLIASDPVLHLTPGLSPEGGASKLLSGPLAPSEGLLAPSAPPVEVPGLDLGLSDGGAEDVDAFVLLTLR